MRDDAPRVEIERLRGLVVEREEQYRLAAAECNELEVQLRDARAEARNYQTLYEQRVDTLVKVEAELAAERAKVEQALAACDVFGDEYYALRQAVRNALAGGEQGE